MGRVRMLGIILSLMIVLSICSTYIGSGFGRLTETVQSADLLPAPLLSSPSNGPSTTDTSPTFSWSSVCGATHYWLTVATSESYLPTDPNASSCPSCVISQVSLTSTSYTPTTPLSAGTYWWDPVERKYVETTDIEPGKGYWVASVNDCTLTL